jgi:large subunit ribosomal protein L29
LKTSEIKAMGADEIKKQLDAKQKELFELRLKAVSKQLKNHREIPARRKDIARLKTAQRQQELGTEKS